MQEFLLISHSAQIFLARFSIAALSVYGVTALQIGKAENEALAVLSGATYKQKQAHCIRETEVA